MNEKALIKVLVELKKENKDQQELIEMLIQRSEFLWEEIQILKKKKHN